MTSKRRTSSAFIDLSAFTPEREPESSGDEEPSGTPSVRETPGTSRSAQMKEIGLQDPKRGQRYETQIINSLKKTPGDVTSTDVLRNYIKQLIDEFMTYLIDNMGKYHLLIYLWIAETLYPKLTYHYITTTVKTTKRYTFPLDDITENYPCESIKIKTAQLILSEFEEPGSKVEYHPEDIIELSYNLLDPILAMAVILHSKMMDILDENYVELNVNKLYCIVIRKFQGGKSKIKGKEIQTGQFRLYGDVRDDIMKYITIESPEDLENIFINFITDVQKGHTHSDSSMQKSNVKVHPYEHFIGLLERLSSNYKKSGIEYKRNPVEPNKNKTPPTYGNKPTPSVRDIFGLYDKNTIKKIEKDTAFGEAWNKESLRDFLDEEEKKKGMVPETSEEEGGEGEGKKQKGKEKTEEEGEETEEEGEETETEPELDIEKSSGISEIPVETEPKNLLEKAMTHAQSLLDSLKQMKEQGIAHSKELNDLLDQISGYSVAREKSMVDYNEKVSKVSTQKQIIENSTRVIQVLTEAPADSIEDMQKTERVEDEITKLIVELGQNKKFLYFYDPDKLDEDDVNNMINDSIDRAKDKLENNRLLCVYESNTS